MVSGEVIGLELQFRVVVDGQADGGEDEVGFKDRGKISRQCYSRVW